MYKRTRWGLSILTLIVGLAVWAVYEVPIQLGIDLRGGTELIYSLDLSRIEVNRATVTEEVKDIISRRLNAYGLKEISVSVQGQDRLVIQLPGTDVQSVDELKRLIDTAGNLTFRLVSTEEHQAPERQLDYEREEQEYLRRDRDWVQRKLLDPAHADQRPQPPEYIVRYEVEKEKVEGRNEFVPKTTPDAKKTLNNFHRVYNTKTNEWEPEGIISGSFLSAVGDTLDPRTYNPAVAFQFSGVGATAFGDLTGANVGRPLAIVLDDLIMEVATIQDRIESRGQLTGNFTSDDVRRIVTILRGGSLPTKPVLDSQSSVGALLGQDTIESGIRAVIIGAGAVMLMMAAYYMIGGMIANVALALNMLAIFAFMVLFRQTLTMPGLAGVLLTLGMAVDANILIFERYREERKRGKPLLPALSAGYDRAFWVIFDSNLTTIITAYVLFYMGTPEIKGFAVTLIAGLFASFFTSVYATRLLFSLLCNSGVLKDVKMLEAFPVPRIPFVRYQKRFVLGSVLVIVSTWCVVIWRGRDNYGIDFTGGARVTMNLPRAVSADFLRGKIENLAKQEPQLFMDYSLQAIDPRGGESTAYTILTRAGSTLGGMKEAQAEEPPAPAPAPLGSPAPAPAEGTAAPPPASTPGQPEGVAAPAPAPAGAVGATPEGSQPSQPPSAPETAPAPVVPVAPPAEATPPAQPGAAPPAAGAGASLAGSAAPREEAAQLVRAVLQKMLQAEGLLLPTPFPSARWVGDEAAGAGKEYLEMDVNLVNVSPKFDKTYFQTELDAELQKLPLFKDVKIQSVSPFTEVMGGVVKSLKIRTSTFVPTLEGLMIGATTPTRQQVEEEIRGFFRNRGKQATAAGAPGQVSEPFPELSDPFPQVLTVGPKVASNLQADALVALFISILGIVFYVSLRFEFIYGLAAIVALVHDALVCVGVMAVADQFLPNFSIKLNLAELAAILSIIGFSVNDTIVLFDRVRENLASAAKRKHTLEEIIDTSVNQTLSRTIFTSLTVLVVTIMLLGFGGPTVRGFSFCFAAGLVAGSYSTVFIASPVALYMHHRALRRRAALAATGA